MIEQLFFITAAVVLFGMIFFKMIKKNETEYVIILVLEMIGIIIDAIGIMANVNSNAFVKTITYLMAIIIPLAIIILEYKKIDVINFLRFLKVKFYIKIGDNKKAKEILHAIIDKNPKSYNAHKMLAEIYEKEGRLRKAIDEYVICIELNKKDYNSYYKVATLLKDLDKKDQAIEMLTTLLDKKPNFSNAALTLGDLLIEKEKYKEAASMVLETLKYDPLNYDLNYELGIIYTMLNDFKSAKEYYEKACELNSLYNNPKYSLGQIALLYKDLDKAEEYFQQTTEDEVLQADSFYELSKINLMRGRKETAIKYANIAVDLDGRKISGRLKDENLFIPIISKISIPFNLETEDERIKRQLADKEILAKEHLENTSILTANMGYRNSAERKEQYIAKEQSNEREK